MSSSAARARGGDDSRAGRHRRDELFGRLSQLRRSASRQPSASAKAPRPRRHLVSSAITWGKLLAGEVPPQTRWGKLADVLAPRLLSLYQAAYGLFSTELYDRLTARLPTQWAYGISATQRQAIEPLAYGPTLHAISRLELNSFIGDRLLRDTDAASMAASLEARVPLLDHRLIETVAGRAKPIARSAGSQAGLAPFCVGTARPRLVRASQVRLRVAHRGVGARRAEVDHGCDLRRTGPGSSRSGSTQSDGGAVEFVPARRPGIYWSRVWALFILVDWCRRHRVSL